MTSWQHLKREARQSWWNVAGHLATLLIVGGALIAAAATSSCGDRLAGECRCGTACTCQECCCTRFVCRCPKDVWDEAIDLNAAGRESRVEGREPE